MQETQQHAMRPRLRHAVKIEPRVDLFLPRDSFDRSRRPSGAKGGGVAGRGVCTTFTDAGFGCNGGCAAIVASASGGGACALAARWRLRSGLICFATLSQSARSSSLRPRFAAAPDQGSERCVSSATVMAAEMSGPPHFATRLMLGRASGRTGAACASGVATFVRQELRPWHYPRCWRRLLPSERRKPAGFVAVF